MRAVEFIQKNIWLVMIAVASGAMLIWPLIAKRFSAAKEVGVADAVQMINRKDAVILDVREPAEFKSGHIPNARNIPAGQVGERLKELEKFKSRPILLACASGTRSGSASSTLQKAGFAQVWSLAGGMGAWQQAGMPVAKDS
jgi:rhodanese-related sulfurtransferase